MKKEKTSKPVILSPRLETKSQDVNRSLVDHKFHCKLHSRREATKLLAIGYETLHELIDQGRIKVIVVGKKPRIPGSEIERFLTESLVTPEKLSKTKKVYDISSFRNGGNDFKNSFDTMNLFEKMSKGVANG